MNDSFVPTQEPAVGRGPQSEAANGTYISEISAGRAEWEARTRGRGNGMRVFISHIIQPFSTVFFQKKAPRPIAMDDERFFQNVGYLICLSSYSNAYLELVVSSIKIRLANVVVIRAPSAMRGPARQSPG